LTKFAGMIINATGMKRLTIILTLVLISGMLIAQQPVLKFEKTTHDFGKMKEENGPDTIHFTFKNEGNAPLVINRVHASCGCTTPGWTGEPILPGKTGTVSAAYNPLNRPGKFVKTISVFSNAGTRATTLTIQGEVIPRPAVFNN
jgi:hypothetical protein